MATKGGIFTGREQISAIEGHFRVVSAQLQQLNQRGAHVFWSRTGKQPIHRHAGARHKHAATGATQRSASAAIAAIGQASIRHHRHVGLPAKQVHEAADE
jgi:hypothetical protein